MKILMHINIRHDTAAVRIVLQIIDHSVHLIHHALFVLMLYTHLITISLADGTVLIRPFIPDRTVQIMDIVGFALPDPQHLIRGALDGRLAEGQRRKFLG